MKNTFALKAGFVAVLTSLACSVTGAATTITVAAFPSLDAGVKAAIPAYKKLHPDVDIKLVSLAFADHHTAMTTSMATGSNLPDVMALEVGFIGRFAESGGLEDLSKPPYNATQFKDKFARFAVAQAVMPNGGLAAIPVDIGPGTLLYRKDIMDKAGVKEEDLTKSWESFIESGKKVKASTGAYMLAAAADLEAIYIRSNLRDGEGIFFDKAGKAIVDSPRFVKAFELAKVAHAAGIDGKIGAWSNEWSEGFKRGQIATQMMGAWLAGHLESWLAPNTKGLWRSAQLPGGAFASWGGSFYAIPTKAQHKPEAWEFIKYLTTDKAQQITAFRKLDAFPALIEAQSDPFVDEPVEFLGGQKARQLWRVAANKIPATDVDKYDTLAQEIVNAELEKVLEQNKDIKQALTDAKTLITKRARR
ncbi:ABC transporter substrate-binding protein [Uliginosibacterium gangwonense]|uniref:ABC transporter substrate-binding protein n=1 Tax=Uliginosibacterium gangwonense TaxID=392736 RepID=UPI000369646B|nr:extracellular solute-binding protein [Uliginosibacterium gangwonense]